MSKQTLPLSGDPEAIVSIPGPLGNVRHGEPSARALQVPATSDATGALAALFSRIFSNSHRAIIPLNARANDPVSPCPAFYCIHSIAGGGGTDFVDIARLMPKVRFFGIQAPPKKIRDPEFGSSVESVADYYARVLAQFQPVGPFMLGGWCAGVPIGLEVANILRNRGREVDLFVVIDGKPENTAGGLPVWHPRYLVDFIGNLPWWVRYDLFARDRSRSVRARLAAKVHVAARKVFGRLDGAKPILCNDLEGIIDLSRYLPAHQDFMKRMYNALMSYECNQYFGKVVVYEPRVSRFHLPQLGRVWRHLAPGSEIVRIEGTHLSMLRAPNARKLAEDLQNRMITITPATAELEVRTPTGAANALK